MVEPVWESLLRGIRDYATGGNDACAIRNFP